LDWRDLQSLVTEEGADHLRGFRQSTEAEHDEKNDWRNRTCDDENGCDGVEDEERTLE
jgi:hypothetical protein